MGSNLQLIPLLAPGESEVSIARWRFLAPESSHHYIHAAAAAAARSLYSAARRGARARAGCLRRRRCRLFKPSFGVDERPSSIGRTVPAQRRLASLLFVGPTSLIF